MIYKPTDLSPSAQTFDVKDTPIFFECKIDTSNVKAEGYTIKILNSENNVVFSSIPEGEPLDIKYITLISELNDYLSDKDNGLTSYLTGYNLLNSGYNGTYLKLPFSVDYQIKASNNTLINSQIFYSAEKPDGSAQLSDSGLYRYITFANEWENGASYYTGDIVLFDDKYYYCGVGNIADSSNNAPNVDSSVDYWTETIYQPVPIYNGQEYKWSITLYQLENTGTERRANWILPNNPLYYDMPLTTGTILGSCDTRIQSVLSEDICNDYFIQPVFINGLSFERQYPLNWDYIGLDLNGFPATSKLQESESKTINQKNINRALIKSYDMGYGFIYPSDGEYGFPGGTIIPSMANGYRIYKRGNNTETLTAYQQVSYVCETPLDGFSSQDNIEWKWNESLVNPGESYATLTYYSDTDPNGMYELPGTNGFVLQGSERIILNAQDTDSAYDNDGNYLGSPYNGIYYPTFLSSTLGVYSPTKVYAAGDRVKYGNGDSNDVVYSCTGLVEGVAPPNGRCWQQVNTSEIQNQINDIKEYDNSTSYHTGDLVYQITPITTEKSALYLCKEEIDASSADYTNSPQAKPDKWARVSLRELAISQKYNKGEVVHKDATYAVVLEDFTVTIFNNFSISYWINVGKLERINYELKSYPQDTPEAVLSGTYMFYKNIQYIYYQCKGNVYNETPGPNSKYWEQDSNASQYKIVATLARVPDADSWGELKNKVVTVTTPQSPYYGKNLQIKNISESTDAYGMINQTPFKFVEEMPLEIYNNIIKPYSATNQYKFGDAVSFIAPGATAGEWDINNSYNPGQIVESTVNDEVFYYINIKAVAADDNILLTDTKYWTRYQKNNYFVCISTTPITNIPPTASMYWKENPYLNNTGLIFYNQPLINSSSSDDKNQNGYLYIRHFEGIENNMVLLKTSTTNQQYYFHIKDYNADYNFVKYDYVKLFDTYEDYSENNPETILDDVEWNIDFTKYQIKTFFRESDENAFYFYTTPVVGIHYSNAVGVDFVEDRKLTEKYYVDYVDNVPVYNSTSFYSNGDVVSYNGSGSLKYYRCTSTEWISDHLPTDTNYWEEDSRWTTDNLSTTEYNKYFNYNKDDIVLYDNKNDFLLYNSDRIYNYGDKVVCNSNSTDSYYISLKDNNNDTPTSSFDKWNNVDFSSSDDTEIKYVALANTAEGITPSGNNIGLYWQQYIGVLFENEGYVPYKRYNNNVIYDVGDIILDEGLYYCVNKLNESYTSSSDPNHIDDSLENSRGSLIWEKYKTDVSDLQLIAGETLLYGPYDGNTPLGDPGLLYLYNDSNQWELYSSGLEKYNNYYYNDGLAYSSTDYSSGNLITTFSKSTIYVQTQTVFDQGILYTCIATTSGHMTNDEEYFTRSDRGQPFGYPISANGRKNASDESKDYKMGNIVLGRGNAENALPDRYYVKINNNTDAPQYSSSSSTVFIPDPSNWEIYYGPMYVGKDYSSSEEVYGYNSVIYEEEYGLYFIKQNINTSYNDKEPIITAQSYSAAKSYNEGDIVLYNNQFFICKQAGSGRPDIKPDYWDLYPWQIFIPEITERTLVVSADYKQQEYIQWKSAQWFLYDANSIDLIDKSDVFYDGDLKYTFHGLNGREANKQQNKYFIIRLILETYNGYRLTLDNTIEVMFTIAEIDAESLIDLSFDCDTTAVKTTVTKETGFIIPNLTANSEVSYDASTVNSDVDGSMTLTGQMDYEKVAVSIENAGSISSAKYIISAAERLMLQAATRIQGEKFQGNLFALYSSNEMTGESTQVGSFEIFVPEVLVDEVNSNINDEILRNETRIQLNNDRNKIMWRQKEPSGELVEGNVVLYQSAVDGEPAEIVSNYLISEEGSFDTGYFFGGDNILRYKAVPMWQNSGFNTSSYDLTNYLPITNETVVIANNGNITVDTTNYRNISMEYGNGVGYNITDGVVTSSIVSSGDDIHIKKILEPGIDASMFVTSSEEEDSTKFVSAVLETQDSSGGSESDSGDTIYIRAKTSAHWSDYQAEVPLTTLVGRKNIQNTQTDYYMQKNVFTKFGWMWDDSDDNNMWSDGDYVESYTGYNSCLGKICLNGTVIEQYNFADGSFDASFDNSDTFFTSQNKISSPILREREVLNNIILTVDMDLSMDADGYITLTPDEITQEDGVLIKPVVYVKRDSSTEE